MVTPNDEITQEQESLDQAQGVDQESQEPGWVSRQDFEELKSQLNDTTKQLRGLQSNLDKTRREQEQAQAEQRKQQLRAQIKQLPEDQQGIHQAMLEEIDRLSQGQPQQGTEPQVAASQRSEEEIAVAQKYGVDPNDPNIDWGAYRDSAIDSDAFVRFTDSIYKIRNPSNQQPQPAPSQQQNQPQRNGVQSQQQQARPLANSPGTGAPGRDYQEPVELLDAYNRGEKTAEEIRTLAAQHGWSLPLR